MRAARVALGTARGRIGDDAPSAWVALAPDELVGHWPLGAGELSGLTFGVKDIVDLAGMPTRCGSPLTSSAPVPATAPFVDGLIRAGALPVGKTVTTEFAYFRPGPTRNPRAAGHTPGGSSSGSAAAVAAGHVDFAIGSQTAGSLVRPASYCGVAGMVLTQGAFSTAGFSGLAASLDAPGLLAPRIADLFRIHAALGSDASALPVATVHVWTGADVDAPSVEMTAAVARAADVFRGAGLDVRVLDDAGRVAQAARDHLTIMAFE
ncbi:MAG: amidase, partial [Microbacterium sp.]